MTTKEYLDKIIVKYPDTYIGFKSYIINNLPNGKTIFDNLVKYPLDFVLTYFVGYIEYRQVNYLEALVNTHYDYPNDNYESLKAKTITHILQRLENFIVPVEGLTF